jgi:predicted ATPase with chaperone activity
MKNANKKASANAQKDANTELIKALELVKQLQNENNSLKVACSTLEQKSSKRISQKENSDYFITKKAEMFKFNNLNEVAKDVENHAESYLKVIQKRLNKDVLTSKEFKTQLIKDLALITE